MKEKINIKLNQIVYDSWWPWETGVVVKVLKTRVHVKFGNQTRVYDVPHLKFLVNKSDTRKQAG